MDMMLAWSEGPQSGTTLLKRRYETKCGFPGIVGALLRVEGEGKRLA